MCLDHSKYYHSNIEMTLPTFLGFFQDVRKNPKDGKYIERMYCNHLYHRNCVDTYMKTPPFTG